VILGKDLAKKIIDKLIRVGRDVAGELPQTVEEQVQRLIQDATNPENLAQGKPLLFQNASVYSWSSVLIRLCAGLDAVVVKRCGIPVGAMEKYEDGKRLRIIFGRNCCCRISKILVYCTDIIRLREVSLTG
jgi:hypothetical protein